MNRRPIVTIDGPAGAGKSTISRLLAERLDSIYLDTGALYRAVAYHLLRNGWEGDRLILGDLCRQMTIALVMIERNLHVFVDGEDVTQKIRTEEISLMASRISAFPLVRERLLSLQREIGNSGGIVAEGRDMGTVVFPNAEFKFFLDASVSERANRRYSELVAKGEKVILAEIEAGIARRDAQDRERDIAPLKVPTGAIIIDSTDKDISQVVDIMAGAIRDDATPQP